MLGMKICSNVPGYMTKRLPGPYMEKTFSFFGTKRPMTLKLGIQQRVLKYIYFKFIQTRASVYKTLCPQHMLAPNTNLENIMYAPIDNVSLM